MTSYSKPELPQAEPISAATLLWTRRVPRLLVYSAALMLVIRVAAPLQIGKDQSQQLEAAVRLAHGQDLTNTLGLANSPDIASVPDPSPLTRWPPGFSMAIAAGLSCGFSLVVSMKLLYGAATAVGWYGWASLCSKLFAENPPTEHSGAIRAASFLAAVLTPVLYTPLWNGTDIMLWAGVPWVVFLTARPANRSGVLAAAAAGGLVGILFAFRYASAFLGLAVGAIMLCAVMPDWKELSKRYAAFGLSALLFVLPVLLFMTRGEQVPLDDMYEGSVVLKDVANAVAGFLRVTRLIFANPAVELATARIGWPGLVYLVGLASVLAVLLAPVLRWRSNPGEKGGFALPLLILPASLAVFLIGVSQGFFLGVPRYYEPVLLCWVMVCATAANSRRPLVAWGARVVLAVFLAYPLTVAVPSLRQNFVLGALGYLPSQAAAFSSASNPLTFPGVGHLFSNKNASRGKIVELSRAYPNALFLTQVYPMYVYDGLPGGPKPGDRIRRFPEPRDLPSAFSSVDRKVFVVLDTYPKREQPWKWVRNVVYKNQPEDTLICEIDVRAGQRLIDAAMSMPGNGE